MNCSPVTISFHSFPSDAQYGSPYSPNSQVTMNGYDSDGNLGNLYITSYQGLGVIDYSVDPYEVLEIIFTSGAKNVKYGFWNANYSPIAYTNVYSYNENGDQINYERQGLSSETSEDVINGGNVVKKVRMSPWNILWDYFVFHHIVYTPLSC